MSDLYVPGRPEPVSNKLEVSELELNKVRLAVLYLLKNDEVLLGQLVAIVDARMNALVNAISQEEEHGG